MSCQQNSVMLGTVDGNIKKIRKSEKVWEVLFWHYQTCKLSAKGSLLSKNKLYKCKYCLTKSSLPNLHENGIWLKFLLNNAYIHEDVTPFLSCKFEKEDFVKQYLQLNSLFSDNKLHLSNLFTLLHPQNGS